MTDYIAQPGAETLTGTSGNDKFVFNFDQVDSSGAASPEHDIDAGDVVDGGDGYDALWAGNTMAEGYSENFDFRPVTFVSIEELDFNWMGMPMPGKVTFNSSQFGSGLSNNLVVKGAWGDNDITVHLDTADFDASGWTFPTPSTTTISGSPAGASQYGWGSYVYTGAGMFHNVQVGITDGDTIHLIGSSADNNIVGSVVADIIAGGDGADVLTGGAGNDAIDGGADADTAVFSGNWSDYTITSDGQPTPTYTIVDTRSGSPDGTDTVTNVENFQFANGTYTAAQLLSGDTTAPSAATIDAWTDTTDPVLINGANPLWRISGTAEAGSTVTLYSVTLNADGTVATRTQLATYSQATATTIVAGATSVVADGSGNWVFQTNLSEHGDRRVVAVVTDASGNVSADSLVYIQGTHHASTFSFVDATALAHISVLDGYHDWTSPATGDTLQFTTATTVVDSDFANIRDVQNLKLTGASTVTLGATALAAGIGGSYESIEGDASSTGYGKVITGNGATSITDTNTGSTLRVEAALLGGNTLTLAGSADFVVSDFVVNNATGASTSDPAGADTFDASATTGTNVFNGGGGNDAIIGGSGSDTAVFSGNLADYTITDTGAGYTIVDNRSGSPDGTDTLTNVENFQFADQTVASSTFADTTAPLAATIDAWTDTTDPVLINGANPLWRISGTAEAGSTVTLYSVTLNADGTVATRTQLATYSQATATTVVAGATSVVADGSGNWVFQTNLSEHGDRRVVAVVTDASGNVSADSLVYIQGSHHATTFSFADATALAHISVLDGYHDWTSPATGDTLQFTTATTVVDSDFAKISDVQNLKLTGASTVTLGATALAAGIGGSYESIEGDASSTGYGKVITGNGSTTISTSSSWSGTTLRVDATALNAGSTLTLSGAADFIATGSDNGVTIIGGNGDDTLTGGAGSDRLNGRVGADVTAGGTGNDAYYVDNALDSVTEAAGAGADTVFASVNYALGAGQEIEYLRANAGATGLTLTGNELDNKIYGGSGVDTLDGGGGNDALNGGVGADALAGGTGNDSYYVDNALDSVTEAAGAGTDTVFASVDYTLGAGQEIEYLRANAGATGLTLTGNELDNKIYGGSGVDTLNGGGGNDALNGAVGADVLAGGTGNDIYFVDNVLDSVTEAAGAGTDTVYANVNYTLGAGQEIEYLRANAGATGLTLTGNELDNKIYGGSGVDTLNGGGGNDALNGGVDADALAGGTGNDAYFVDNALDSVTEAAGAGTDTVYASVNYTLGAGQEIEFLRANAGATGLTLTGNELANRIYGGSGNDTIDGGAGNDVLVGGLGQDTFVFASTSNGLDTVYDFASGTDTLSVSASGFGGALSAGDSANLVTASSAAAANAAGPYFIYVDTGASAGTIYYDATGGSGADAVAFARLTGTPTLTAGDIQIVA